MIEQHLRECISIPHGCHLRRLQEELDPERTPSCLKETFQLLDEDDNLVTSYKAWQVEDDFFGFLQYDSDNSLVDRKTIIL
ncbi:hypothetical protein EB809_08380 [Marinobacter sp. R17]|uniref:hypothetical protein n=1 Tax=Marinobacter TaxID=2742 RepID=UPI000F4CAB02|nr:MULTISPECIES: hypothetical protein [Marinobacter]ROU00499.1 hypothetical protein EB809_08380 [Marinobacter sp. R17]